jgi:hypothetical protein
MISSFASFPVTGPGTYSVRCRLRDPVPPEENPLSQAMPLPSPAVLGNRSAASASSEVGRSKTARAKTGPATAVTGPISFFGSPIRGP